MGIQVDGRDIQYDKAPPHSRDTLRNYIEHRLPPGSFMTAFLSNDLMGAIGKADDINRNQLFDIAFWLYNYAPPMCFGSPERVRAWLTSETTLPTKGE